MDTVSTLPKGSWLAPLARVLLAAIFVLSGVGKIFSWQATTSMMEAQGFVVAPFFLAGAIAIELIGGVMLLIGYHTKAAAWALVAFLIPATILFHNFWAYSGEMQVLQQINFMKNLAIMGGLLHVAIFGAGAHSWDATHQLTRTTGRDTPAYGSAAR